MSAPEFRAPSLSLPQLMNDPFGQNADSHCYDIDFSVPQTHRLRFTNDCFGDDFQVVRELFHTHTGSEARVQVWCDDGVATWDANLCDRIEQKIIESDELSLVGPITTLPGGESIKNDPSHVNRLLESFNSHNLDRRSYVAVIGGGAVLDAVGYAAAIAHRGIRLVRFPTSTLAQADSGVGVKNAVNWFDKKNWKGTFATPWAVVNDQRLLDGLSDRDFRCGYSEAIKVALLKDRDFFSYLVANADAIADRKQPFAETAIRESVLLHLKHITRGGDPFEARQARPLDFGHWSAHKLEALTNYEMRHGEAVSIGIVVDVAYSHLKLGLPIEVVQQTLATIESLGLPSWTNRLGEEVIFDGLEEFRQHLGGQLTITLLKDIGQPIDVHEIDRSAMREAIAMAEESSRITEA
ncbi:MAG: 3-dehydroquinate synthase [Aureliella sp.]